MCVSYGIFCHSCILEIDTKSGQQKDIRSGNGVTSAYQHSTEPFDSSIRSEQFFFVNTLFTLIILKAGFRFIRSTVFHHLYGFGGK